MQNKIGKIKLIDRDFEKFLSWVIKAEEVFPNVVYWKDIINLYKDMSHVARKILFSSLKEAIVDFK